MTWITSEREGAAATTDGKYQVRGLEGQAALYQSGLGRPLMVGSADDCRHLAEVLEGDQPLEDVPPLRGRAVVPLAEIKVHLLAGKAARSATRLRLLRAQAAPREMVALELDLLRRVTCELRRAVHELPEPT